MVLLVWMIIKCVVLNLLYGGVKGGICVDLFLLLEGELECLICCYISEIGIIIGLQKDIFVLDVGINGKVMVWMMDMYFMNYGMMVIGVVIGKFIYFGGLLGCEKVMGCGVFVSGLEVVCWVNIVVEGVCVVVQGFGNVGSEVVCLFVGVGVCVVVIQDYIVMLFNVIGIDMKVFMVWQIEYKQIVGFLGVEIIVSDVFWCLEMDILILVVFEGQIICQCVEVLMCKLVLEGVNGLIYLDVDDVLVSCGIFVVFDVVCNVGGVIVSYFEWV